jgi:hypothetical protein
MINHRLAVVAPVLIFAWPISLPTPFPYSVLGILAATTSASRHYIIVIVELCGSNALEYFEKHFLGLSFLPQMMITHGK